MSYVEQLQRLAVIERALAQAYLRLDAMDGEIFDRTLVPLLAQLYGAHEMLCRSSARRVRANPPRPA
jgi:hypothetical protein